jgi:hypothetical protein
MLKKKYDKSDMKKSMQKQYGKEEGKKVYFATIRKQAMNKEEYVSEMSKGKIPKESQASMLKRVREAQARVQSQVNTKQKMKKANQPFIEPKKGEVIDDDYKYNVSEEGLRDWFGKSSGTTKSGRKVRGWVQVGGKYDGKPCARQPGQKSTPKCVSSSKRRSMSKSERDSAARRKRAADPNQPQKSGAAKPTNVSTDPKRKMKENYFDEAKRNLGDRMERKQKLYNKTVRKAMDFARDEGEASGHARYNMSRLGSEMEKLGKKRRETNEEVFNEAKDKKGKGSGTKDACYHKVKSRYSVWPSAYASGALVKCRKVGAANWGNKSKNEGFSPMQVAALESAGMIEIKEGQKCWKGYEKKGTKMMFGKRYNNCVKKKTTKEEVENIDERMINVTPSAIRMKAAKSIIKKDLPKLAAGAGAVAAGVAAGNKMSKKTTNEGVQFLKREKEKKNLSRNI